METEFFQDGGQIKREKDIWHHSPKHILIFCQFPDPPSFSLPTTFNRIFSDNQHVKKACHDELRYIIVFFHLQCCVFYIYFLFFLCRQGDYSGTDYCFKSGGIDAQPVKDCRREPVTTGEPMTTGENDVTGEPVVTTESSKRKRQVRSGHRGF